MRNSLLKLLWAIAGLALSTSVYAVGLGSINVSSALGQTLNADIELVAISKAEERASLNVRLASQEAYKDAGLEYPYGNKYKFEIQNHPDGQPYIKVSSAQPVNDPFVSLLVELTWSAGKLSREYTFLLDPPGYVPVQPPPAKVKTVAPVVQAAVPASTVSVVPLETAAKPVGQAAPAAAVTPAQQAAPAAAVATPAQQAAPAVAVATPAQQATQETAAKPEKPAAPMQVTIKPAEKAAAVEVAALPDYDKFFAVKRGDTMYIIAKKYKLANMDLDRMLVALYRVNADKFDGRNMNRIRAGKVLRLPSQDEYSSVTQAEAEKEIHAQAADWNAYGQKLASAASRSSQSQAVQQVATGKISSSVADMAPVAKESAKEVLKLSKGEAPGDQVGAGAGGEAMSEQDKKNAAQEDAIAKSKALKEEQERTAMLEKNLQDMQRLAQLKVEAAALAKQSAAAKAAAVASEEAATAKPKPVEQPKPVVQPKPKPKPVVIQPKPEPSMLDEVLDEPLYLAVGVVVLLALGGLGYMVYRRKSTPANDEFIEEPPAEDVGDITGRLAAPVVPSPDTGDFTVGVAPAHAEDALPSDIVDPISEADLFLNFGRDVQAEEILKDALQNTPNNHQIHLKLLGIYASRKDTNSFSTIAHQLKDSGDDAAWQQAAAMGRKLEPENPMYGGGFKSMEDTGSATVQTTVFNATPEAENVPKKQASALDFDFDAGPSTGQAAPSPEQDFLSGAEQTSVMSADGKLAAQGAKMDFDITSSTSPAPVAKEEDFGMDFDVTSTPAASEPTEAPAPMSEDLVFDITGSHSSFTPPAAKQETSQPAEADDGGMAFTLDFPVGGDKDESEDEGEDEEFVPAAQPAAIGLEGINLNFDEVEEPSGLAEAFGESAAEGKDDQWQEVATKLDLAKAYHEMGDASGAREILDEVMREGDAEQRESAQALFELLG